MLDDHEEMKGKNKYKDLSDDELRHALSSYRRYNWYSPDDPRGTLGEEIEQIIQEMQERSKKKGP